jgi:hypothetical protein
MISPDLILWLSGLLAGLGLALLPAAFRAVIRAHSGNSREATK